MAKQETKMSSQAYRTSAEIEGVWFLEEPHVLELDSKIESHFEALKRMRQLDIAEDKRKKIKTLKDFGKDATEIKAEIAEFTKRAKDKYPHSEEYKTVTIKSGMTEVAICSSFAEVLARPEIHKTNPTGFVVKLQAGKNLSEFSLNDGLFSDSVKIKVEPDSEPTAAFLVEIERWAETHRVNRFLRWWHRNWLLFPVFASLFLMIVGPIVDSKDVSYDGVIAAQKDARRLIEEGVSDANRDRAISTLLKLGVDTNPTVTRRYSGWWSVAVLVTTVALIVVGFMPPRSIIGIGCGKNTIYWRKAWFSFWTRTFPFTIVGGIAIQVCLGLISSGITAQFAPSPPPAIQPAATSNK